MRTTAVKAYPQEGDPTHKELNNKMVAQTYVPSPEFDKKKLVEWNVNHGNLPACFDSDVSAFLISKKMPQSRDFCIIAFAPNNDFSIHRSMELSLIMGR